MSPVALKEASGMAELRPRYGSKNKIVSPNEPAHELAALISLEYICSNAFDDSTSPLRQPDRVQSQALGGVARESGASSLAASHRDKSSRTHYHESSASTGTR